MRKLLFFITILALTIQAGAQTIQKGNKFFNGSTLYTVQEIRMGTIVYMTGENAAGDYLELTSLEPTPSSPASKPMTPLSPEPGSTVLSNMSGSKG